MPIPSSRLIIGGKIVWAYQVVHHDVWDDDMPAQPGLFRVSLPDGPRDVVVQVTKSGHVFVLDRDRGAPVLQVEERPVPQRAAAGEALSLTQPFPVRPPRLVPNHLKPEDAFGITLFDRLQGKKRISELWSEGPFSAPPEQGTIQ